MCLLDSQRFLLRVDEESSSIAVSGEGVKSSRSSRPDLRQTSSNDMSTTLNSPRRSLALALTKVKRVEGDAAVDHLPG